MDAVFIIQFMFVLGGYLISIFHSNEPDSFTFHIVYINGLWSVLFEVPDDDFQETEARFKSKVQALEYVGLRLINFYGGV